MSNLMHCDGPDCRVVKDDRNPSKRWGEESWLKVEDNWQSFDFHSRACLVAYYATAREPETKHQPHDAAAVVAGHVEKEDA